MLKLVGAWPWLTACAAPLAGNREDPQQRFKGVGIILVVDAVTSAEMRGVMFYDDQGQQFFSSSLVAHRNRGILSFNGTRVPLSVRAMWGEGRQYHYGTASWDGGSVLGDYTVPVAERIPDEVLADIRAHGGGLRLKFRLKPDGVLLGWDIERSLPIPGCDPRANATCRATHFFSPGGDFLETRY